MKPPDTDRSVYLQLQILDISEGKITAWQTLVLKSQYIALKMSFCNTLNISFSYT